VWGKDAAHIILEDVCAEGRKSVVVMWRMVNIKSG